MVSLAVTFARAMKEEARWRAGGGRGPTTEEKTARRAACDGCPDRDAGRDACTLCGCYLEAGLLPPRPLGKLDCATQQCPKGLWSSVGGYAAAGGCGGRVMTTSHVVEGNADAGAS